jgi:FKBP-type peptidyl-prolyl cis-trans isomerase 2
MTTAKSGDAVTVHYRGTLDDGTQFDASHGRDPLAFTLGSGQVIVGFDVAVTGMAVGEKKTVTFPPEEAYGPVQEEMIQEVARERIPPEIELEIGTKLQAGSPGQPPMVVTVIEVSEETVKLDANHELAGKALTFELELVSIG